MKRSRLKSNPETHREWQERTRRKLIEAQRNGSQRRKRIKAKRKSSRERDQYIARVYGSRERLLAIKALPCAVPGCDRRPSENHHLHAGRDGRVWENVVPLCGAHHRAYHDRAGSAARFAALYSVDLEELAERLAEDMRP